ncbi:uncharacterized protein JCM15063_004060 [Sporobolomyces koalae]|uniref:uncharacterized protein n=1 Tax=Sporobolomyces koalae TaxID=500713 RepID=UPI00316CEC90
MPIYAFGSNEHGQLGDSRPTQNPQPVLVSDCDTVLAASWAQVVVCEGTGDIAVRGLPLERSVALTSVKTWLGQDEFVAVLLQDGTVQRLSDGVITSSRYRLASMNSRGQVLLVPDNKPTTLLLYDSLNSLFAVESDVVQESQPTTLDLPFYPSTPTATEQISSIEAGAAHFLVLASPSSRLFSLGDNRYGQLGIPNVASRDLQLRRIDALDGFKILDFAAGAFHSVVLTEHGEVYVFGLDKDAQCGGGGGGSEPYPVNDSLQGLLQDNFADEDGEEIVQVAAAGPNTVLRTKSGAVWLAGANCHGQLGIRVEKDSLQALARHPSFGIAGAIKSEARLVSSVRNVVSSRWTTYLEVEEVE